MINRHGFKDEFFKLEESGYTDTVVALSRGAIRLYCCKYGDIILIIGSGGIKITQKTQEDPIIDKKVKIMAQVSKLIDKKILDKELKIIDNELIGDLNFE